MNKIMKCFQMLRSDQNISQPCLPNLTSVSLLFFLAVLGDPPSLVAVRTGVLLFKFVHSLHQLRKYYKCYGITKQSQHNTKGPCDCDNGTFPLGKRGNSLQQTDHKQAKPEQGLQPESRLIFSSPQERVDG